MSSNLNSPFAIPIHGFLGLIIFVSSPDSLLLVLCQVLFCDEHHPHRLLSSGKKNSRGRRQHVCAQLFEADRCGFDDRPGWCRGGLPILSDQVPPPTGVRQRGQGCRRAAPLQRPGGWPLAGTPARRPSLSRCCLRSTPSADCRCTARKACLVSFAACKLPSRGLWSGLLLSLPPTTRPRGT